MFSADNIARARRIKLMLFDVDGVMTDGRVSIDGEGREAKQYHIRDGTGLVWARKAGLITGILSGRSSPSTLARARQLGITVVRQGTDDKLRTYLEILDEQQLEDAQVCFMGDDVIDLAVLGRVGLSAAPADAVEEVRARVHWTSARPGGHGAVRELVDQVLRAQGHYDGLVARHTGEAS